MRICVYFMYLYILHDCVCFHECVTHDTGTKTSYSAKKIILLKMGDVEYELQLLR